MNKNKKPTPPPRPKQDIPKLPPQTRDKTFKGQVPKMENPPPPPTKKEG